MRSIHLSFLSLLSMACVSVGLAHAADTKPASAAGSGKVQCESQSPGGDFRNISCPLDVSSTLQRFRFKVDFSGGHDDTMASMTLSLDGAPLACEQGSKTQLMGEDGDVSLECRFSLPGAAGTKRILGVALKWSHAQYTDFELVAVD
jgi:hypothetical protein